jgi:hypothetical protein
MTSSITTWAFENKGVDIRTANKTLLLIACTDIEDHDQGEDNKPREAEEELHKGFVEITHDLSIYIYPSIQTLLSTGKQKPLPKEWFLPFVLAYARTLIRLDLN